MHSPCLKQLADHAAARRIGGSVQQCSFSTYSQESDVTQWRFNLWNCILPIITSKVYQFITVQTNFTTNIISLWYPIESQYYQVPPSIPTISTMMRTSHGHSTNDISQNPLRGPRYEERSCAPFRAPSPLCAAPVDGVSARVERCASNTRCGYLCCTQVYAVCNT